MRVLSLFAGMGGFDLAFEMAGFDVVAQVEIDSYCQRILRHHFPQAKLYGDIRRVTGEQITGDCGAIDVVCGGFPCQETYTTTIYSSMYCRCLCEKCGLKLETYKRKDNENNNQKAAI